MFFQTGLFFRLIRRGPVRVFIWCRDSRRRRRPMIRTALFLLFVLSGCSAFQQTDSPIQPPELVKSASLPPIVSLVPEFGMRFDVMILVLEDGSVAGVKLLQSSNNPDWDSLALHSIMKWQFLPARR